MGYFTREDIPFYYALADAFTVCDQHFCSSLTGTTPNRLHFFTGTIRAQHDEHATANVYNADVDYGNEVSWKTFPEYLEENNISWKIYQNEVSIQSGFEGQEEDWLANFTDNPIEWFRQFNIRFAGCHMAYLQQAVKDLPGKINALQSAIDQLPAGDAERPHLVKQLANLRAHYDYVQTAVHEYTPENFEKLSPWQQGLHAKAFSNNNGDVNYRSLESVTYEDGGVARTMQVPKGDVLFQLRQDVQAGKLPTVSWVVAPSNFSDHPGSPWYGAWYLSEVFDILTQNPEVWKKTIFILNYDENDGYFDHVPPFVPPDPYKPNTGKASAGIDAKTEYVSRQQAWLQADKKRSRQAEGPIGLGFRVPLVIASPWSRGGWVNSEVCDLTSPLQFLEVFLSHKTGKRIYCNEITAFRRAVCGNLTSVFRPYNGEAINLPATVEKEGYLQRIHAAQFKPLPAGYTRLSPEAINALNLVPSASPYMAKQEKGTRPACAIPYQLYAEGQLDKHVFQMQFSNSNQVFGEKAAGAPFIAYDAIEHKAPRNYVVLPGDTLTDAWQVSNNYHFRIHGPNGFYREFAGTVDDPAINIACHYETAGNTGELTGGLQLHLHNTAPAALEVTITDNAYKAKPIKQTVAAGKEMTVVIGLSGSSHWYDVSVSIKGREGFERRYAGHVETGQPGLTDPFMGGVA